MTCCGRSDGALARMEVLSPGSSALSWAPVAVPRTSSACSTRAARSSSHAPAAGRWFGAVALKLADQTCAQHPGQRSADRRLDHRDVLPREHEQRAAHRHPPDQTAPVIHGLRDVGQSRCGTAGQNRQIDGGRITGMQCDHRPGHRLRAGGTTREVVTAHQSSPPLLHRDHPHHVPPRVVPTLTRQPHIDDLAERTAGKPGLRQP